MKNYKFLSVIPCLYIFFLHFHSVFSIFIHSIAFIANKNWPDTIVFRNWNIRFVLKKRYRSNQSGKLFGVASLMKGEKVQPLA